MIRTVIDTNVIVALLDKKDVHHKRAVTLVQKLEEEKRDIILMDCIIVELYSVIARRSRERGYDVSQAFQYIRDIESIYTVLSAYYYRAMLHQKIIELMALTDGKLSYHDALIALVMKKRGIKEIATFDKGFEEVDWIQVVSS